MTLRQITSFTESTPVVGIIMSPCRTSLSSSFEFMFRPQLLIRPNTAYIEITTKRLESEGLSSLPVTKIILSLRSEGIPLAAIANMARVERKSVYSWLNDGAIRLENQNRMEQIYDLLFNNKQANLLYLYRFWNMKIWNGISLNNLLSEKNLNTTAIKQALSKLWPLAKKYEQNLRQSYQEANDDKGQKETSKDWQGTLADEADEW